MYKILNSDAIEWNKYIEKLPFEKRDIYFTREYLKLYEINGDGTAKLFVYEEDKNIAIYPFLIREIEGYSLDNTYYDMESAYGYGGPVVSNENDNKFLQNFERIFIQYCNDNNIIAEFIRFNPCIKNEKIFTNNIAVIKNRTTVSLNLNKTIDDIWKNDIKSKNRNMIRKAEKNGLYVEIKNDYSTFKEIYEETMGKVSAYEYYYFKPSYYDNMENDKNYIMLNVKLEDKIIASAIFMKYGEYFHYHLAGSRKEYLGFAPNNLLLWEAIKYANQNGYKLFHFGGGLTNSLEDNLFKFKSSFSNDSLEFYIGKRIHNVEIYNFLINKWEEGHNRKASILLQYREV
ncbi:Acetyltransferase (GNAT) domain-containing protein [Clostridium cavendishii DSM 21758]|uniref:Acetyltransferase (GNAT) domain-containing protein n=1 Tax=Clostridium cavendishii DSM 21758 TaxID=1121302 RepID=A0A1M6QAH6_9CLOT|nr:GNAT family N-acetyltransferase [Clostridium cavendishii]SHK17242.1 Acetyltransferase (GNAT) domain-containing protein [Clostridium cavendishii DSM 21758]